MGRRPQKLELTWFNKDQALIPTEEGKYGYTWVDPKDPRYCETHTLVVEDVIRGEQSPKEEGTVYSERADLEPTDDNLLILGESGDVLEALTRVPELAEKYVGQVKCVYIDPPFNTAQTFANYEDNLEHSIWLTMMRDRLIHLRRLLSGDGSIWVHLDHTESHRMRSLLDEVFGASNFVSEMVWEKAPGAKGKTAVATSHDNIMVYAKSKERWANVRNLLPRTATQSSRYANPDNDPRGPWRQGADGTAKSGGEDTRWPIELPSGRVVTPSRGRYWAFSRETFEQARAEGRVYFGKYGDGLPIIKTYLSEAQEGTVPVTWWRGKEVGTNQEAKRDHLNKLFPDEEPFTTPKPERLLERVIHIATSPGDVILDIFAGSGTTAAVAQKMGRRWVTCELIPDTVGRFTRPRLQKVVNDQDPGGVTSTNEVAPVGGIEVPDKNTPQDFKEASTMIGRILKQGGLSDEEIENLKVTKNLLETRKAGAVNWRGGGSFTVARLSPSCFDYDPELDLVTLTEAATGQTLVESAAANLGFYLTPEDRHFDGVLGRQNLAVVEGVLDDDKVDDLMAHLPQGHTALIAATIVTEGVREYVRGFKNGSRVVNIPLDIFTYTQSQEEN